MRKFRVNEGIITINFTRESHHSSENSSEIQNLRVKEGAYERRSAPDAGPTRGTTTESQQPMAALSPGVERPRQCCPSREGLLTQGIGLQG